MGVNGESGFVPEEVSGDVKESIESDPGAETLYEKVKQLLSEKPEDLEAFDKAYAERLDNSIRANGEEKALDEMRVFLEKAYANLAGPDELMVYQETLKKKINTIEQKYTNGW